MASYPGAVKTFAPRNAGDVIQPAHMNDVQDEINAIEDGLLNGVAPLNSSNSTVVNLSVTGNSTIAGTLTVTGALTAGSLVFSTIVTANAQPRCRVFHGSTQTSADNAETVLTFNSEDYDVGGLHSTASNPTRITCGSTGLWMFGATVNFVAHTGATYVRFRKNGTTAMGSASGMATNNANGPRIQATAIEQITATTDYVEVLAFHVDGFSVQTGNGSSRIDQNEFWAVKLW